MRTFGVVKALDVYEYGTLQFLPVTKMPSIQLLFLEKFEEGLHNRIIVRIARSRERLYDIVLIQKTSKLLGSILRSSVGMKQHRLRATPFEVRLFHRVHYELSVCLMADTPRDDFS